MNRQPENGIERFQAAYFDVYLRGNEFFNYLGMFNFAIKIPAISLAVKRSIYIKTFNRF